MLISSRLFRAILEQYRLPPEGVHGVSHWARVAENARRLSERTGAHRDIVTLFAYLHDACRASDDWDPEHGVRAAELADRWRGTYFDLSRTNFELLYTACAAHGDGLIDGDVTLQTCWDADRLDIGRVGMMIIPSRLCTDAARDPELIVWADRRARHHVVPEWVRTLWTPPHADSPPPDSSQNLP